jgi:hypothetical protein
LWFRNDAAAKKVIAEQAEIAAQHTVAAANFALREKCADNEDASGIARIIILTARAASDPRRRFVFRKGTGE